MPPCEMECISRLDPTGRAKSSSKRPRAADGYTSQLHVIRPTFV